ncbi:hypothetical protein G9A89_003707 [Geosiphon pyriformis]|nr:hypothetical protein G9A89_003707 [Geosiphon pyriformis]
MALLGFLFQLLPGCIRICISGEPNGATKVVISDEFSGVASVFSLSLLVVLCNILLGTSSNDIKTALGIFGVIISVKLKPAGLWQYAVVNFKDISSAAVALSNWSVLVKNDSVRILLITNQKEVISQVGDHTCFIPRSSEFYQCQCFTVVIFDSLEFLNVTVSKTGILCSCCIWWETPGCCHCYRCQDLNYLAVDCKKLPSLPLKLLSNIFGGPKNFKSSFVGSKSYAKAAAFVVPSAAVAADMDLDFGGPPKTATSMLPAVPSVSNSAVESRLASLKFHLSELSVLIKSLVEPVSALVALVTKLLSTPSAVDVSVKECAKQNKDLAAIAIVMQKRITHLEKICEQACLENESDGDDMVDDVDDDNNGNKDFLVYDNVTGWSNKLMDSKREQYCMVMEINKERITIRERIE